jgi:NADH dehydrogenase [ubiquinone] 1 alpha subcomplex assembly factor 5
MTVSESDFAALFDRRAWRLHRERAGEAGSVDFLRAEIADRLIDRLGDVERQFPVLLEFGLGGLAGGLQNRPGCESLISLDPSARMLTQYPGARVVADLELPPLREGSVDLVLSNLVLHWVGDLPGAFSQLRRILKPDGLLLAAMFGGATLHELRTVLFEAEMIEEGGVSPRVSPMAELQDAAALLLRAGFAMPVADAETITVTYPNAAALMRDLRGMGETNALTQRRRSPLRRATLGHAIALYEERFGLPDGRVPATFEILFLTGWAPAPGQPQPLRPGSATHRLAEALGATEIPAGDTAAPPPARSR